MQHFEAFLEDSDVSFVCVTHVIGRINFPYRQEQTDNCHKTSASATFEFENEAHELLGLNHTMTIVLYWDLFPLLGCFSFFIFSFTFGDGQLGERTINVLPISPPDHMTITFFSINKGIGDAGSTADFRML